MNSNHSSPQRVIIGYESPPMKARITSEYGRHQKANARGEVREVITAVPYEASSSTDTNFQMRYRNNASGGDDGFRGPNFPSGDHENNGSDGTNVVLMNGVQQDGYDGPLTHAISSHSTSRTNVSNGRAELSNGYSPHQFVKSANNNNVNGAAELRGATNFAPNNPAEEPATHGHHYQIIAPHPATKAAKRGSIRSTAAEVIYAQPPALQTYVVVAGLQEGECGGSLSMQQQQHNQQDGSIDGGDSPSHHDRRIRDAARKRQRREIESNGEAELRRAKNLAAKRRRLERETDVERSRRRARDAETKRVRRQRETPPQRAARLSRDSERMRRTRRLKKLLGPAASLTDHDLMRRNGLRLEDLDTDPIHKRRCIRYGRQDAAGQQAASDANAPATSSTLNHESNPSQRKRKPDRSTIGYGEPAGTHPRQIVHHQFVDPLPTTYVNIMTQEQGTSSAPPAAGHLASHRTMRPQPSVQVQVVQQAPFGDGDGDDGSSMQSAERAGLDPSSSGSMAIISSSVAESTGVVTLHLTLPDEPHREHVLHLPRSSLPQRIVVQRQPHVQPAPPIQRQVSYQQPPPVYSQQRSIAPPEYRQRATTRSNTPALPPPPHIHQLPQPNLSTPKARRPTHAMEVAATNSGVSGSVNSVTQTPSTSSTAFNSPGQMAKYSSTGDGRSDMAPGTSRADDPNARRRLANAERSRRRRAMESPQQRAERNRKTAERMRLRRSKLAEERLNIGLMTVPIEREIPPLSEDRFEEIFRSVLTHQSALRPTKRKVDNTAVRFDDHDGCALLATGGGRGDDEDALLGDAGDMDDMLVGEEEEVVEDGFDLSQDLSSQGNFADELEQIMANEHGRPSTSNSASFVEEESQSPILRRKCISNNDLVPGASTTQPPLLAPLQTMEPLVTAEDFPGSLEGSLTL